MEISKTQIAAVSGMIVVLLIGFGVIGPDNKVAAEELLTTAIGFFVLLTQFFQRRATGKVEKMLGQRMMLSAPYTPPEPKPTIGD